jgi:phenylacetate-coenzyme A ligase PaaK-like adenylate-forming protein
MNLKNFENRIFQIDSDDTFNETALEIFRFQHQHNRIYREFADQLKISPDKTDHYSKIPFLPISFFKSSKVHLNPEKATRFFQSSGTTGDTTSRHYFHDISLYEKSFDVGFRHFFGDPSEWCFLALLPSYHEREGSSLIYMVRGLMKLSLCTKNGFFLDNSEELANILQLLDSSGKKTMLIGVSFALLDFVEKHQLSLKNTLVVETGGMKGRRREMIREELHRILCHGFGLDKICSEYGMTELFSQAWSKGDGIFETPPWMRVLIRDTNDPLSILPVEKSGGINVIDLANLCSCSFIATQDLGKIHAENQFEVLGRFDNADIRGCNLLVF